MRLIDADELLKEFDPDGERIDPILVRAKIINQPTAYDVDKVKNQLIDETANVSKKYREAIYKSIETIKAGGVNET